MSSLCILLCLWSDGASLLRLLRREVQELFLTFQLQHLDDIPHPDRDAAVHERRQGPML
jgi:hypothetical protein